MILRRLTAVVAVLAIAAIALWLVWPDLMEQEIADGGVVAATAEQIETGRYLARAGNCVACHTTQGEPAYAGGRHIPTPFGYVYSSNLTPDRETGLGDWTSKDFYRALHYGKSRDGHRLYPAFPFTNYTVVSREDSDAIFAYLRSLEPVRKAPPPPALRYPYNTTFAQMAWRAIFFRPGNLQPRKERSNEWNRGVYLVEGLGHCNACHTSRDSLGGIKRSAGYSGGRIPMLGWDSVPLTSATPMTDADATEMTALLKAGIDRSSAVAGPMSEVVYHSLQYLKDDDLAAMVAYIRTLPTSEPPVAPAVPQMSDGEKAALSANGATVYKDHCAACHGDQGEGKPYVYPALAGNRLLGSASATNAIQITLSGGFAPSTSGNPRPYGMPPFSQQLSNEQVAAVLTYVRSHWGNNAPGVSVAEVEHH